MNREVSQRVFVDIDAAVIPDVEFLRNDWYLRGPWKMPSVSPLRSSWLQASEIVEGQHCGSDYGH